MRAFLLLVLFAGIAVLPAQAQTPVSLKPTMSPATHVSTSIPLRDMRPIPHQYRSQAPFVVPERFPYRFDSQVIPPLRPGLVDPVLDAPEPSAFRAGTGSVLSQFEGTSAAGTAPPDPTGEIGPNHYVQMVNSRLAVYSRAGALLLGPVNNNQIWVGAGGLCETNNDGDPIVLYDETADRWLISQFVAVASAPYAMCVAISQTADPTGAYHRYEFGWPEGFPDYPKFGVWPTGYALTTSLFPDPGGSFSQAVMLERDQMLIGGAAQSIRFTLNDGTTDEYYSMLPADFDGPAPPPGTPALFAGLRLASATPVDREVIRLYTFTPDWTTPANSTLTYVGGLPVAPFDVYALFSRSTAIPQLGTADRVAGLGHRPMMRLQYRNVGGVGRMLFNHTIAVNDVVPTRTGVRWYELRDGGTGTWSIHQQGTYAPSDGQFRWVGSMAMNDNGDIGLAYSVSSSTMHPSIRFTGQTAAMSGTGVMDIAETEILAGTGSQTGTANRWGDYSHLSVDPADGTSFWYTNEYYATTSSFNWRTRIAHFDLNSLADPVFAYAPGSISVELATDAMTTETVTIQNTAAPGAAALTWSASIQNAAGPALTAPTVSSSARSTAPTQVAAQTAAPAVASRAEAPKKDDDVTPSGPGVVNLAGGPDAFGNTFEDSDEVGGPAFVWVDISGTGTAVTLGDDAASSAIALPFAFPFYGINQSSVFIGSNGLLTFGSGSNSFSNQNLPSTTVPNNLIAMYWDDLNPELAGSVHYQDMGDGRFIVQFTGVPHYDVAEEANTFQAILYEAGQIDLQYLTMTDDADFPNSQTIGIENASGSDALQVVANAAYMQNNLAIRMLPPGVLPWTPPVVWATVSPTSGSVAPGASATLDVDFDATGLADGIYTADLVLATNDPATPTATVPLTMVVGSLPPGAAVLNGNPGWYLMGYPGNGGAPVDHLATLNLVAGVPGYYPTFGSPTATLHTGYSGSAWLPSVGIGETVPEGEGFLWYFFDNAFTPTEPTTNPSSAVAFPVTLSIPGAVNTGDATVELSADGNRINALGNPFGTPLDVTDVRNWPGGNQVASKGRVFIWDPNLDTWLFGDDATTVEVWQGFAVRAKRNADGVNLTIPASASSGGTPSAKATPDDDRGEIAFVLDGTEAGTMRRLTDRALRVTFDEDGTPGWDDGDAEKFAPLSEAFVVLGALGAGEDGETVLKAAESRASATGSFEVPLALETAGAEAGLTLRWPTLRNLPVDWQVTLVDEATGESVDLRRTRSYVFSAPSSTRKRMNGAPVLKDADARAARQRFTLRVDTGDGALVEVVETELLPVRPNPIREVALVEFVLAESTEATVTILDIRGREVTRLASGVMEAGRHEAYWTPSSLAPGVYVVRLVAGDAVLTRRAVIVR